jgi:hypothetical protein
LPRLLFFAITSPPLRARDLLFADGTNLFDDAEFVGVTNDNRFLGRQGDLVMTTGWMVQLIPDAWYLKPNN